VSDADVVREQFEATNARDFERAMNLYAEDVVLVVSDSWGVSSGTYEGKVAVGDWFGDWFSQFAPGYHFEITEARELGGGVVYLAARHGGAGRASGAVVGSESGYLYRVVDGLVDRVGLFATPADATEASSLPEWSCSQNG
jgi:ketosteroid isomerase-like protein